MKGVEGCRKLIIEQPGRNLWSGNIPLRWSSPAREHSKQQELSKQPLRYERLSLKQ